MQIEILPLAWLTISVSSSAEFSSEPEGSRVSGSVGTSLHSTGGFLSDLVSPSGAVVWGLAWPGSWLGLALTAAEGADFLAAVET